MRATLDASDIERANKRQLAFDQYEGPRVGDYVIMPGGSLQRFSHDWGDSIQTTDGIYGSSFYIEKNGFVSFSGGLNPSIAKSRLTLLTDEKVGPFWFFHDDFLGADRGVQCFLLCRVYQCAD